MPEDHQFPDGGPEPGSGLDRREFLNRLAALAAAPGMLAAAGCGSSGGGEGASSNGASSTPAAVGGTPATSVAVPGPPFAGGTRGGTAVVTWPDARVVYDPPLAYDEGGYYGLQNFYRGLFTYNEKLEPQPDLAESVDVSDDGLTYVFKLKPDVTFHNGREVTAEDFKWTLERSSSKEIASWVQNNLSSVKGHAAFVKGRAKEMSGIKVVDPRTLRLDLDEPDVTVLGSLGIPPFYVLPREEVERLGDQFNFNPIGTGPYKLDEYDKGGNRYSASRFEDYLYSDTLPYLDGLDWRWAVKSELAFLRTSKGESDSMGTNVALSPSSLAQARRDPDLKDRLKQWDALGLINLAFDVKSKPFDDKRVRQAMNHAVDRERLKSLQGYSATGHYFPKGLLGFDEANAPYEYDPERAKSLLAEAGYGDGFELTLPVFGDSSSSLEEILAELFKAVGIRCSIRADPASVFDLGTKVTEKYKMWRIEWGMGLPDPSELTSSLVGTDAPSNYGGYGNAKLDALAKQGKSESDRAKRESLYAEIEGILLDDAGFLFIGNSAWYTFTSDRVENLQWEPVNFQHWDRTWLSGS